jgi:hypothetical protein
LLFFRLLIECFPLAQKILAQKMLIGGKLALCLPPSDQEVAALCEANFLPILQWQIKKLVLPVGLQPPVDKIT